jgi:hypothetical protein
MQSMNCKRKSIAYVVILVCVVWAILPWITPVYTHNLVLSIKLSTDSPPTYEVQLQNLAPWPVSLNDAQWRVTHNGIYNYWVPSEAPIQTIMLLPLQAHSFQFTIYRGSATTVDKYYNGTLTIELLATINVIDASSSIHLISVYNATT